MSLPALPGAQEALRRRVSGLRDPQPVALLFLLVVATVFTPPVEVERPLAVLHCGGFF